jgi:RND family efflux transporter MFP subunit
MVLLSVLLLSTPGCGGKEAAKPAAAPSAVPVTVIKALSEDIPDYRYYPGISQAVLEAEIVARVEGYLERRDFIEGDDVLAGQRMYLIQQEEYEADLVEAIANQESAEANLDFARYTLNQTEANFKGGAGTVYEVDQARATYEDSEATLESAKAQVLNARLNLSYTEVLAPFDGRVGETNIDIGNLVGPENSQLATLVMLDPMRVVFEPAGTELVQFLEAYPSTTVPVQVTVHETNGESEVFDGALDLVDNVVDQSTSTFLARGVFANPNKLVLPGLYVSVRVRIRTIKDAIMIPDAALHNTPTSQYVYIVDDKSLIQKRVVTTSVLYQNLRRVVTGLKAGEEVIVLGSPMMVRQGAKAKVTVVDAKTFVSKSSQTQDAVSDQGSSESTDK